jgi:hypothetical protein
MASISAVSTSFVDCSSLASSVVTTVEDISVRQGESFSIEDKSIAKNNPSFAVQEVFVKDLNIDYSSVLGSGTFGTVYKGNWAGSEVAIKAISINNRSTFQASFSEKNSIRVTPYDHISVAVEDLA